MDETADQSDIAKLRNRQFFLDNITAYRRQVENLDTYRNIRNYVTAAVSGVNRLLDIGNGGVFDYDVTQVNEIVALDLFFDQIPEEMLADVFPLNVKPRTGSALAIPEPDASYDAVLMVMLIHHLVGDTVVLSTANVQKLLSESWRVLKPGGKMIIVESCVPRWFYALERLVYPVAAKVIGARLTHPPVLQYPPTVLGDWIRRLTGQVEIKCIPRGRWVIQLGVEWPSALTPVAPYLFTVRKPLSGLAEAEPDTGARAARL